MPICHKCALCLRRRQKHRYTVPRRVRVWVTLAVALACNGKRAHFKHTRKRAPVQRLFGGYDGSSWPVHAPTRFRQEISFNPLYIRTLCGFSHTISRAYAGVAVACTPDTLCTTMAIWPGSAGRVSPLPPETWMLMLFTPFRADNKDCTSFLLLPAINFARLSFWAALK
jgi:hypothetical protein